MEDKKYEAGRAEISSAEYRDLIEEATKYRLESYEARSEKWKAESERDKLKAELEFANEEIASLRTKLNFYSNYLPSNLNGLEKKHVTEEK